MRTVSSQSHPPLVDDDTPKESLTRRYARVRSTTLALCESLHIEDYVLQSMPDASPAKWHLAHTTWFFETFVLEVARPSEPPFDPSFRTVFNSYYKQVGEQFTREKRGTLSRPTVQDVTDYRAFVDDKMQSAMNGGLPEEMQARIELGLHHEEQHQELLVTDLKHGLGQWACPGFPLGRPYSEVALKPAAPKLEGDCTFDGGVFEIGHKIGCGFAFDSETPRHRVLVEPFRLARDVVRNHEFLTFIRDGGYERSELWLSDGWDWLQQGQIQSPLYWSSEDGAASSKDIEQWQSFTLHGLMPIDLNAPVTHLSFFEADAFARWANARLPTEQEWEVAASTAQHRRGAFLEDEHFQPLGAGAVAADQVVPDDNRLMMGMFGDVWEWTSSAYLPYPGFAPLPGALGEYNGKFMNGQRVLRGGSIATPRSHIRATYRNFFQPEKRWQMTGLRLAKDAG